MIELDVDGLFNVRADADARPWIVRSGAPDAVTPRGAEQLRALGVTAIVDLREPSERRPARHGFPVVAVPLYGEAPPIEGRLEHIYEALLRDRGEALASAVAAIADAEGAALVHCTAGKDRTGLVVALAQRAVGRGEDEVVADYALSGAHVRPVREEIALAHAAEGAEADRAETLRLHLDSPPEAIRHALAVIDELGGAAAYLRAHGLGEEQLEALRAKASTVGAMRR
ncbi:tyrosine-protein phosphatase [Microbacterium sediminis]|uniref:Uncharacterized protein n=1 Tax=Microbacterium sediminis TaxID=904291 RepID=A0A1B9NIT0_9MICO|nr:tyrosine-protein phosphatase [Microbacterium sediminis]OCG76470.1 hypothetical protein A7J15_11850 [Microbacterium sediminis]QBR73046.1 tyrosine-protein phosphatase [Microbacterium sediminis]